MKWFDYQLLTEQESLLQCIKDFLVEYKMYCREIDREENLMGFDKFNVERPFDFRHTPIMLVVMKFCDKHNWRYDAFWGEAFRIAMRFDVDVYSPAFFSGDKILKWIKEEVEKNQLLKLSNNPYFKAENYREDALQKEYYNYVYSKVKDRKGIWERMAAAGDVPKDYLTNM